jgi:hypothetical protein
MLAQLTAPLSCSLGRRTLACVGVAWLMLAWVACGDGDDDDAPDTVTVVSPAYEDPCPTFDCSGLGECIQATRDSAPSCVCVEGYAGDHCDACAGGYHRDANDHCLPDVHCVDQKSDPCGAHGDCTDEVGVISCMCEAPYLGARCNLCAPGYEVDADGDCLSRATPAQ